MMKVKFTHLSYADSKDGIWIAYVPFLFFFWREIGTFPTLPLATKAAEEYYRRKRNK